MRFRTATRADVDAIVAIDHVASSEGARVELIVREVEASACHVALARDSVVAYAVLNYKFYDNGWMEMLHVEPSFRRRGVGSSLVRHLTKRCRTPKLFTSTNRSNVPMRHLLEALGFDRSGTIDNLDDGDPELVYLERLAVA